MKKNRMLAIAFTALAAVGLALVDGWAGLLLAGAGALGVSAMFDEEIKL